MSELFATETMEVEEGKRGIPGSAILKAAATALATELMAKINDGDQEYIEAIQESQTSTAALDELVKKYAGAKLVNPDIAKFGEEEIAKLLKSNQSNRSRRKNMPMTMPNYTEMLTAACAEWIIRESCGITKSSTPFGGGRQAITFDEAGIAALADDQEALGKAIRNIQSKKSSYKAKHADNPAYTEDAEWVKLLDLEKQLKDLRVSQPAGRKGLSMKKALQFLVGDVDVASIKKDESIELLTAVQKLAKGEYPEEYLATIAVDEPAEGEGVYVD